MDTAAILLGCVTTTLSSLISGTFFVLYSSTSLILLMMSYLSAVESARYCGNCVDFPEPVSPVMTVK